MALKQKSVLDWLESLEPGWDVDDVANWIEEGKHLGGQTVEILKKLRLKSWPMATTRAIQIALNEIVENAEAAHFPYFWHEHKKASTGAALKKLETDTKAISLFPPATKTDFSEFTQPLARLNALDSLRVDRGQPSNLSFLAEASTLKNLHLCDRGKSGLDLDELHGLTELRFLYIGDSKKLGSPESIGKLSNLESLYVRNLPATAALGEASKLRYLGLVASKEKTLKLKLPKLESANIESGTVLEEIAGLETGLANVKKLRLAFCPKIEDLSQLASLSRLEELQIQGLPKLSDISWIPGIRSLRTLRITQCPKLKNMEAVGELGQLEVLDLSGLPPVESLDFVSGLTQLKHLHMVATKVKNKSYAPLHNLAGLLSVNAWRFEPEKINALRQAIPQLVFSTQEAIKFE